MAGLLIFERIGIDMLKTMIIYLKNLEDTMDFLLLLQLRTVVGHNLSSMFSVMRTDTQGLRFLIYCPKVVPWIGITGVRVTERVPIMVLELV